MATISGGSTPIRYVRVPDEIWEPALAQAKADDTSLAELIREWLLEYVSGTNAVFDKRTVAYAKQVDRIVRVLDRESDALAKLRDQMKGD
jgi:hypothetical protein